ncbi:MAG: hypothetical protein ACRDJ5_00465, partial [Actinomycetota bacterium]
MAGRRTNLALLVLLAAAVLTGGLAYGIGTSSGRVVTAAHAVVGVAIVALSPWKSIIARRGLRRSRAGKPLSLWLTGLVALALVSGVLHSTGALVSTLGITAMQVHVGAALVSIPLAIRHVRARPVHPRRMDLSRRQLLRSGALLGGSALAYLTVEWAMRAASVAGSRRRFTGSFETGTFDPEAMPVTQWLDDSVQEIEPSAWTLELRREGRVERLEIERLQEGRVEVEATLD